MPPKFETRTMPGPSTVLYKCAECDRVEIRANVTYSDGRWLCPDHD
jgi:hypothetical protein